MRVSIGEDQMNSLYDLYLIVTRYFEITLYYYRFYSKLAKYITYFKCEKPQRTPVTVYFDI